MASCKECYHYEVCRMHYRQKCELTYETEKEVRRAMLEAEKGSPICDHFKDRSRFVELPPCKEGDSVYSICFCYGEGDTITEWTVVDIFLLSSKEEGNSVGIRLKDECIFISISPCELGNRYFLTKEEAEQALKLKERENDAE